MNLDYQSIFRNLPGLYLILDPSFVILEVSESYLEATLTERANIMGKNIFNVFPDNPDLRDADGVSNLQASLEQVLKSKKPHSMPLQRYDVRLSPGSDTFVRKFWSPRNIPVLAGGEVVYVIHRVEDVTSFVDLQEKNKEYIQERTALQLNVDEMQREIIKRSHEIENSNKELRDTLEKLTEKSIELERSNMELSNFAMIASHDIKAPFRIVGRYLELIQDRVNEKQNDELTDFFERIYRARERIANLLDDLLNFAMVSASEQKVGDVPIQIVLEEALANLEAVKDDKKAVIHLPDHTPVVYGEKSPLVHLFQNLIANALKFNTGTPDVTITYTRSDNDHLFTVSDNGIGIKKEYFAKVFDVFQRLHGADQFPGTGLGLSMCKRVVERHGGKIWIESSPGKGATFFFTLKATN